MEGFRTPVMRASGVSGLLRVGYQQAAALGAWEIAAVAEGFRFCGTVESEHAWWITQRPLDLVLALGTTEWIWRDIEPERSGATLTVLLTERPIVAARAMAEQLT